MTLDCTKFVFGETKRHYLSNLLRVTSREISLEIVEKICLLCLFLNHINLSAFQYTYTERIL